MESVVVGGGSDTLSQGGQSASHLPTIQSVLQSGRPHSYASKQSSSLERKPGALSAQSGPTLDALLAEHDPQPVECAPPKKQKSRRSTLANSSSMLGGSLGAAATATPLSAPAAADIAIAVTGTSGALVRTRQHNSSTSTTASSSGTTTITSASSTKTTTSTAATTA
eukprot:CAMPEP_0174244518 /NCGR_PEP_ID=MMETSP0417-20130205/35475_1 /TAXON_ID=242541 /ORGANISM="Mayorella sp, Strain BSH-02190019" /LENGTH=166 /DNA_ID=CAMNT_0015324205 /DNA_START=1 /DNA_END=498 /DNA_ORIENTATION=+